MLCPNSFELEKKLIAKLIEVVKFCTSNSLSSNDTNNMDSSITDFLNILKELESDFTISFKFHNLCHYKLMTETYGLPKSWSCERDESTNAVLKQLILISKNRVNVSKTCFRKLIQRRRLLEMLLENNPSFDCSPKPPIGSQVTIIRNDNGKVYEIE